MVCFSFQLGTRLAEIGPLYDWPNESVILLSKMPQAAVSDPNRQVAGTHRAAKGRGKALAAASVRRDHEQEVKLP
jgi:hypothetical protein